VKEEKEEDEEEVEKEEGKWRRTGQNGVEWFTIYKTIQVLEY